VGRDLGKSKKSKVAPRGKKIRCKGELQSGRQGGKNGVESTHRGRKDLEKKKN